MEQPPLASLSLTHVHYNPYDRVSYLCAWLALVPQALCITYATLIWSTREVEILLMFVGQMGCEAFNWLLKRYIKEERPRQMNGKGYGMPSSHAQFLAFFSVSLTLFLLFRHNPSSSPDHLHNHPIPFLHRVLLSLGAVGAAAAVAGSRIYLNYHTPRQVLVGCAAGAITAVAWFIVTEYLRRAGWVSWALDNEWARWARMRDLVVSEDLADAGWARWEGRRIKRSAAGSGEMANGNRKTR
ncbi:PAP2-domain-containing protein [Viridothelium virens]|uniref:Dolichyldiphosphatase n=1 Tax=Viridothelium virens TaxID=1048519 RepID=A0A6A6HKA9_VIRVR|nr:PAP2-domain-containing protein [Viridothelium virens]